MTELITAVVCLGVGFGAGWYVKERGMSGVQNDLNALKVDVFNLKAKLSA